MTTAKRTDLIFYFENVLSNPNGDPLAGGRPRVRGGYGRITPECIKRRVRNYIRDVLGESDGMRIYLGGERPLSPETVAELKELHEAYNKAEKTFFDLYDAGKEEEAREAAKEYKTACYDLVEVMCREYIDLRLFGGALANSEKKMGDKRYSFHHGLLRGPVRIWPVETVDPVRPLEVLSTRCVRAKADSKPVESGNFSRKGLIPFGLFKARISINHTDAGRMRVSEKDIGILIDAMLGFSEFSRASGRTLFYPRLAVRIDHEDQELGDGYLEDLGQWLVPIAQKPFPQSIRDYVFRLNPEAVPEGVDARIIYDKRPEMRRKCA